MSFIYGVPWRAAAWRLTRLGTNKQYFGGFEQDPRRLGTIKTSMPVDPLLTLLRRYQAQVQEFDTQPSSPGFPEHLWDRIARSTWVLTQDEIINSRPSATTAVGALAALEHVVKSKDLFEESSDLQMLWQLVVAAHDYFAARNV